jgi:hypothetical protein
MTSTAIRAASRTAKAAAAELVEPTGHTLVAASAGSQTTSREPRRTMAAARQPAARFASVSMTTRIAELAKWIAALPSFTFAEAAAASAPSPCSPSVMAYTLPDARLASALAELGYQVAAGGKNGYTVTAIEDPARRGAAGTTGTPGGS